MPVNATNIFSKAGMSTPVDIQKPSSLRKLQVTQGPEYFNSLMYSSRSNIARTFVNSNITFKSITQDFANRFAQLRPLADDVENAIRPFLIGFRAVEEGTSLGRAASSLFKASCRMMAMYLKIFCWDEVVKAGFKDQVLLANMETPPPGRASFEYGNMPNIVAKLSFRDSTILKCLLTICNESRLLTNCDKACDSLVTGVLRTHWTNIDRELRIFESLVRPMCKNVRDAMNTFRNLTTGGRRLGIDPEMGPYIVALTRCYVSMWQFLSAYPTVKAPYSPGMDICTAVDAVKPLTRAVCDVLKQFAWHFGLEDMRDDTTKRVFDVLRYDEANKSFFPVDALLGTHKAVLEDISIALEAAIESGYRMSNAIRRTVYDRLNPSINSRARDAKYKANLLLPIVKYFENEDFVGELAAGIAVRGIYSDQKCSFLRMHHLAIIQRRSLELEALYCVGAFTGTSFCDNRPPLEREEGVGAPPENPFRCVWAFEKGFTVQVVRHVRSLVALVPKPFELGGNLNYPWPELSSTVKADLERVKPILKTTKEEVPTYSFWQRIFGYGAAPRKKEDRFGSRLSLADERDNLGCCI